MTSHPSFNLLIKYRFTERTFASHRVIFYIPYLPRLLYLKLLSNNFTSYATNSSFYGSAHDREYSSSPRLNIFIWKKIFVDLVELARQNCESRRLRK